MNFDFKIPVNVAFGAGKLSTVGEYTKQYGKKALIVTTGPFFKESGLIDRIQGYIKEAGISSEYFLEVSPNPHRSEANVGIELAKKMGCDVIIGLGGGSAMDAAKCIAVGVAQKDDIWPYWMGEKDIFAALPIIAITTTSGTGSHVTRYSVITNDETLEKPGAGSEFMYAKVAIVDPELMLTVPKAITAATGFDVLAHSIEAYTCNDAIPFTDLYCEQAIRLTGKYLPIALADGSNLEVRENMALADTYAGYSITAAMVTLCHGLSHVVCGIGNLVHGTSLAALTPASMRHSMSANPEKYKNIGCWLKGMDSVPADWTTEDSVKVVEEFISAIGLNVPLGKQGIKESDFDRIIEETMGYMGGACDCDPAEISAADIRKVLEASI